jgi:hypothetical protein
MTVIDTLNASQSCAEADNYPSIRVFTVAQHMESEPQARADHAAAPSPSSQPRSHACSHSLNPFSTARTARGRHCAVVVRGQLAVNLRQVLGGLLRHVLVLQLHPCAMLALNPMPPRFFGLSLVKANSSTPVGLIATDWGGTIVEAWTSPEGLEKCTERACTGSVSLARSGERGNAAVLSVCAACLARRVPASTAPATAARTGSLSRCSTVVSRRALRWPMQWLTWLVHLCCRAGMIYPFLNMTIAGATWYQSENNWCVCVRARAKASPGS